MTGAGIMRDCAMRGIDCILIEKDDLVSGTTGRNHSLLHSGDRYAASDNESAKECIHENKILKNIENFVLKIPKGCLSLFLMMI